MTAVADPLRPGQVFRDCDECPEMVVVNVAFRMVSGPATIAEPFAIGVHPVTAAEWDACVQDGGCGGWIPTRRLSGGGASPVIDVSWHDATAYALWLSERTGREYRLPSDGEWRIAAERHGDACRGTILADGSKAWGACGMDSAGMGEWTADCWYRDGHCLTRSSKRYHAVDLRSHQADLRSRIKIRVALTMN